MTRNNTRKDSLLIAAQELFSTCGYAETTFKRISEKAGVALGLLTHHYGNKEKLFLTAGMNVLDNFLQTLQMATARGTTGFESVMNFCRAYIDFYMSPDSFSMVLLRCSPYSDMKAKEDRDAITEKFLLISGELEANIRNGIEDGSIRKVPPHETAQVLLSCLEGGIRSKLLTPYAPEGLFPELLQFIGRSLRQYNTEHGKSE